MKGRIADLEHFIRAAVLLLCLLAVFLVVRGFLVPKGFGLYGHYRAGALADIAARPLAFAGRAACADCHSDVVDARKGSKHERIGCEACHGALAAHAADPSSAQPVLPDTTKICLVCHAHSVTRPVSFPQVDPQEHSQGQPCTSCHRPHHPEIE